MPPPPDGEGGPQKKTKDKIVNLTCAQSNSSIDLTQGADTDMDTMPYSANSHTNTVNHSEDTSVRDNVLPKEKADKVFNLNNIHLYGESFYAYIESIDEKNIGRLHPMYIGHILLKKLNISNITSINSIGRNRIKVLMKSAIDVNNLVKNKQLASENLRAFIPNHLVERKGLIKGVDTRFDEKYILYNIISNNPVTEVKRMHRRVSDEGVEKYVPRQLVIVAFEGNILPKYIVINSVHFVVEPFVGRVIQCYKCLKYGHVAKQCKSAKSLCTKCAKDKLENHLCQAEDLYCIYCKNNAHTSTSKECPNYINQKKIKEYMSTNNIPFVEAKNSIQNAFSTVLSTSNKFDILSKTNFDQEFPALPNSSLRKSVGMSFSQPSTSNHKINSTQPYKKRKTVSSPISQPTPENMFPFRMGPDNPLPPNPYRPNSNYNVHGETLNKMTNYLTQSFQSLIRNVVSVNDLKKFDDNNIKNEINRIVEGILKLNS